MTVNYQRYFLEFEKHFENFLNTYFDYIKEKKNSIKEDEISIEFKEIISTQEESLISALKHFKIYLKYFKSDEIKKIGELYLDELKAPFGYTTAIRKHYLKPAINRIPQNLSTFSTKSKEFAICLEEIVNLILHTLKTLKELISKQNKIYDKYKIEKKSFLSKLNKKRRKKAIITLIREENEIFTTLLFILKRKSENLREEANILIELSKNPKSNFLKGVSLTFSPETGVSDLISLYYYGKSLSVFFDRKTSKIYEDFLEFKKNNNY